MTIHIEEAGDVTVLRLAHGKANALDTTLCRDLVAALTELSAAPAIVLTGTAGIFSARARRGSRPAYGRSPQTGRDPANHLPPHQKPDPPPLPPPHHRTPRRRRHRRSARLELPRSPHRHHLLRPRSPAPVRW